MKSISVAVLIAMIIVGAGCASTAPKRTEPPSRLSTPDTIIYGGPIYTGLDNDPTTDAVAVEDGVIVSTGNRELLLRAADSDTYIIDLDGAAMYPGFTDAHAHLFGIGMREMTLNLENVGSIAELAEVVKTNMTGRGATNPLYGRGWIETGWPESRMPTRDDIDLVSPNIPVILVRADGHAILANSAALAVVGVDDVTPDPEGGRIERDANGRATGLLIDNAQKLVASLIENPSGGARVPIYKKASEVYTAYGWTGIHNMSADPDDIPLLSDMTSDNTVRLRVFNYVDKEGLDKLLEHNRGPGLNRADFQARGLKLYADGALGSRGALLSAPYADAPETSGLQLMNKQEAMAIFEKAIAGGIQIATHAIGDQGNKLVLDWYEEAFARNQDAGDLRFRIEHAQILRVEDIARFKKLGVIASMQPSHAIGDLFFALDRLGPDRLDGAYAWKSLLKTGAIIPGGSDAPVERGDPLIEFYAAVARRGLDGTQSEDWRPSEAVSREQALKMFTSAPAYASFSEQDLGTIEPGKQADFTVFSADIMKIPAPEILNAKAIMTIISGEVVYRADH